MKTVLQLASLLCGLCCYGPNVALRSGRGLFGGTSTLAPGGFLLRQAPDPKIRIIDLPHIVFFADDIFLH